MKKDTTSQKTEDKELLLREYFLNACIIAMLKQAGLETMCTHKGVSSPRQLSGAS